jgi:hypothetical protein
MKEFYRAPSELADLDADDLRALDRILAKLTSGGRT